jgi:phosphatidylserine/phosphatidylglycerophosphate/cardiolipin synthase-like enzyme
VTDAIVRLAPSQRGALALALEGGLLAPPYSAAAISNALGSRELASELALALRELDALGVSGGAAAHLVRAIDAAASRASAPDLVWSGPSAVGVHARGTRSVYDELLGSAEHSIWMSSYVFFDGPRTFSVLAERMDARPDLKVVLMLNLQRKWGDTTAADELIRRFVDRLWRIEWPGNARPQVYYDPRALDADGPGGVLHAKAVVTDDEAVFVTSANLTEAALDRNIELGVLMRDRALALRIVSHFRALIDRGVLVPLPPN